MSDENEIKPGDVVVLKSGGPPMTVDTIVAKNTKCKWFAGTEIRSEHFMTDGLRKQTAEDK